MRELCRLSLQIGKSSPDSIQLIKMERLQAIIATIMCLKNFEKRFSAVWKLDIPITLVKYLCHHVEVTCLCSPFFASFETRQVIAALATDQKSMDQ